MMECGWTPISSSDRACHKNAPQSTTADVVPSPFSKKKKRKENEINKNQKERRKKKHNSIWKEKTEKSETYSVLRFAQIDEEFRYRMFNFQALEKCCSIVCDSDAAILSNNQFVLSRGTQRSCSNGRKRKGSQNICLFKKKKGKINSLPSTQEKANFERVKGIRRSSESSSLFSVPFQVHKTRCVRDMWFERRRVLFVFSFLLFFIFWRQSKKGEHFEKCLLREQKRDNVTWTTCCGLLHPFSQSLHSREHQSRSTARSAACV